MAAPTNAQLASQIVAALQQINAREAQLRDWLAGSATGGPNGDGRFPITNASGETFLYESVARLIDMVDGPAAASDKARLMTETARDTAVAAQQASHDDAAAAGLSRKDSLEARDLARQYRDDAASHAANLQITRSATDSFRESAQLARDEAVKARDDTVAAKGVTLTARAEAVTARDDAERFAASINPAVLATRADLSTELAKLVGQSPSTLDTLQELAAALGNDPNFATSVATQLGQKAALVHAHGMADISGLQSALDGKAAVGHGHTVASITGLQAALDAKQAAGAYLSLAGGTLTGPVSVPSSLEVRAEGEEGGQLILKKGSKMTTGGDVIVDALVSGLRIYDNNGTSFPSFFLNLATGALSHSTAGTFWNQTNMGAGSGLNADMVDGRHASEFLLKTGGTLSGALTVANGIGSVSVNTDGALEIRRSGGGAYIDFKDADTKDFDVRIQQDGVRISISGGVSTPKLFDSADTSWYVQPSSTSRLARVQLGTDGWHTSVDGKSRYFFSANGRSYSGSPDGYEWRDKADVWKMILEDGGNLLVRGQLHVGYGQGASWICMRDDDEGERYIHCNSNRIGFLNQSGSWGSFCNDDGSWQTDSNIYAAGDITAFSDRRLKSDIRPITQAVALIKALRGVRYTKGGKASLGVIAQEVQEVFPELVHEHADGILSVAYGNLVGVLIEAVKELAGIVEGQQ